MSVKAFELVPVIENLHFLGDKIKTKIECIECCDKELYLGTSDSFIILYSLEEQQYPDGKIFYTSKKEQHKYLELKKPVMCIKAASALNRILVLCDSHLLLLSMTDLEVIGGPSKLKGISTFCMNDNPNVSDPFCAQICCGFNGKRQLQVYNVTAERMTHVKEVSVAEPPITLALDGAYICAALQTHYAIYNFETSVSQQLFTYGTDHFLPLIKRITKEEFLLSAPGGLGMFVTTAGISNRPPIQWSYPLHSFTYSHPYILGVSDQFIIVYSILDQQQKQALPLISGRTVGNFDGRIYASSSSTVHSLAPVPWESQVEALLDDLRVDEALDLACNVTRKQANQKIYSRFQQKAAFIYFSQGDFLRAGQLFQSGTVDIREVISLFPDLLPSCSTFIRTVPSLHGFADVEQLFHKDTERLKNAYTFLTNFLEQVRDSSTYKMEIDIALLKLYSKHNSSKLEALLANAEPVCDVGECCDWLERNGCHNALALLHHHAGDNEKALQVWAKIVAGECSDGHFRGLPFIANILANLKEHEHELVWRYADFILDNNEELGVNIFTLRPDSSPIDPNTVVDFLHRFPGALIKYLQYLVLVQKIPIEKFHTQLAVLYLERILKLKTKQDEEAITEVRTQLQTLLQQSSLYRVQLLLGKMQDAQLYQETAILYGKIEEHEKALNILVHQLEDFKAAEEYCVNTSKGKDSNFKQYLFQLLLNTYLKPKLESGDSDKYLVPALNLLNAKATEFDAAKVLEMMPLTWSITVIQPFLQAALRGSLHKYRMSKMTSSLARGENLQKRFALYDLQRSAVSMYPSNYCCVCKKPFSGCSFARYPNNIVIHPACIRHNTICPITGKNFKGIQ